MVSRKQYSLSTLRALDESVASTYKVKSNCDKHETTGYNLELVKENKYSRYKMLDSTFPSLRATVESIVSLIFSQPIVSEDGTTNSVMHKFLNDKNIIKQSNIEVLIEGMTHALIYGRCGFRFLSSTDGLVFYPSDRYTVVYNENTKHKGFYDVDGFIIARRADVPQSYGDTVEMKDLSTLEFNLDFTQGIGENEDYLYLHEDVFFNFHFYGNDIVPDTPLNHDRGRLDLFTQLITNLTNTLQLANNQVDLVQLKENLLTLNSLQASDIVATSLDAKTAKRDSMIDTVQTFANKVASQTKRGTLIVPNTVDSFKTLGLEVDVSEFLDLYDKVELFISKLYGVSNNVLTLEKLPRDASANPIFEQMMKTAIYPKRNTVQRFINSFLKDNLKMNRDVVFAEESYALGMRVSTAQTIANVVSTLYNAEIQPNKELIESLIYDNLKRK